MGVACVQKVLKTIATDHRYAAVSYNDDRGVSGVACKYLPRKPCCQKISNHLPYSAQRLCLDCFLRAKRPC